MFWVGLAAGFILGGAFGLVVGGYMGRRSGEAESDAAHQRRQNDAIIADQERADAKEDAAQAARRVPVDDRGAAADVLRKAGRLRKTGD